ncbi:hypothetical protein JOC94_002860 [Bacillus thermophilus]|uniref:Uncharacterized protein n=1 Tax=Siminovitchia thermophila TaxID=1245522 RepID=A0ABS2R887_9BACI|nr:hypothetical protein [Siminovitchia thermophila]ONK23968.1 hypothetical protein BLX87_07625 [Bacillus sp. VT-16-64]
MLKILIVLYSRKLPEMAPVEYIIHRQMGLVEGELQTGECLFQKKWKPFQRLSTSLIQEKTLLWRIAFVKR